MSHKLRHRSSESAHDDAWLCVTVDVSAAASEHVALLLFELGANGIEEAAAPGDRVVLTAYLSEKQARSEAIEDALAAAYPDLKPVVSRTSWDPNDDSWRQHFAPFEIVPGIVIAPSWESLNPQRGRRVITIDPGMAFGTGLHPTTRLCATAIYESVSRGVPRAMLDVGCGSGILSLVAHALGISDIAAVENDDEAASIARDNFRINGSASIPVAPSLHDITSAYPLVVANILLTTLIDMSAQLIGCVETGGRLVLSGITRDQGAELVQAFAAEITCVAEHGDEEWLCIVMERNA